MIAQSNRNLVRQTVSVSVEMRPDQAKRLHEALKRAPALTATENELYVCLADWVAREG